jgi:hypothetical protein
MEAASLGAGKMSKARKQNAMWDVSEMFGLLPRKAEMNLAPRVPKDRQYRATKKNTPKTSPKA